MNIQPGARGDVLLSIENLQIGGQLPGGRFEPIVKSVNMTVNSGEVVAIIGESGSGKTTTSLAALGYARPGCRITGGQVFLNGVDVLTLNASQRRDLRGKTVAYVAQSAAAAFNPAIRIGKQVTEGSRIHKLSSRADASKYAVELYRRLDLPEPEALGFRYPHQVSGGQLQRLMAAMAVSTGPDLLVLDEPTTALDVTTQIEVLTAFKEIIRQQGTAAIYVTHDLAVVAQIADRILVMFDGEVVERGLTEDILRRPQHDYTKTLMAAVRPSPKAAPGSQSEADMDTEITQRPLLEIRGVNAGYGRVPVLKVLNDIQMSVSRGEVTAVIGESGCGKSTLARVVAGLLPPLSGEILLSGQALPGAVKQRTREQLQKIQIVFQMPDVAVNPKQKVRDIVGRPLDLFLGGAANDRRRRIGELLEMVEIPRGFESRYPGELSGGQKQRVNLARALAANPEVILCDEVTSSLDTVVGAAIIELLKQLQRELGVAYVFISHDLSTVASFADRIIVLYAGRVVEKGARADVLSPPYHPYTRLLLSSVPEMHPGWLEGVVESRTVRSGIAREVSLRESGCPFVDRCPLAIDDVCDSAVPPALEVAPGHSICCHRRLDELVAPIVSH